MKFSIVFAAFYVVASLLSFYLGPTNFYLDHKSDIYWLSVLLGPTTILMVQIELYLELYRTLTLITFAFFFVLLACYLKFKYKKTISGIFLFFWLVAGFLGALLYAGLHYI